MKSFKEYKERKEAQRYFRSQNDQFLSTEQWIKTMVSGLCGAIVIGIVHGLLTIVLPIDFSIFYIVVGIATANIINSSSGVSSAQTGIASVICTVVAFLVSNIFVAFQFVGFPLCFTFGISMFFSNSLFGWIFVIFGLFAAYYQASENRFM